MDVDRPDEVASGKEKSGTSAEDPGESEATNQRIRQLFSVLQDSTITTRTNSSHAIDMMDLLVDRQSVVQTIENFFDFAFLIKDKRAVEQVDRADGLPYVLASDPGRLNEQMGNERRQMVLSMSIPDVRAISELLQEIDALDGHATSSARGVPRRRASSGGLSADAFVCPLHREGRIYDAETVEEQTGLFAEKQLSQVAPVAASPTASSVTRVSKRPIKLTRVDESSESSNDEGGGHAGGAAPKKARVLARPVKTSVHSRRPV
ncbi:unnamed protein product [Symbiodinium microadriaticum]|nr:unnamed protein product [Symbiodinium microadriaticum]